MRLRHSVVTLLIVMLVVSGCTDSGAEGVAEIPPTRTESPTPPELDSDVADTRRVPVMVSIRVAGDVAFEHEQVEEFLITRVGRPEGELNLLSVGIETPQKLADPQERYRFAFDIVSQYEDRPGAFEVPISRDPGGDLSANAFQNLAFLTFMRVVAAAAQKDAVFDWDEVEALYQFDRVLAPCYVEVGENATTGSLDCPSLGSEEGHEVSLSVRWELP